MNAETIDRVAKNYTATMLEEDPTGASPRHDFTAGAIWMQQQLEAEKKELVEASKEMLRSLDSSYAHVMVAKGKLEAAIKKQ